MKFLLTNDDGIDAPGLGALQEAARTLGEVVVTAPHGPQSGVSHAVTWERSLRLEQRAPDQFAVHGTPADCARLGFLRVAPDANWILSGINFGGNLGADTYYSGTVAAVREAVLHGWPGIALSQYVRTGPVDWTRTARWAKNILADLLSRPVQPGQFFSVNFPQLPPEAPDPEAVFCPLDPKPLPLSYRPEEDNHHMYDGDYNERPSTPGSDVDVCFNGRIAVTEIKLF